MLLDKTLLIPDLGPVGADSGFHLLTQTEDGRFIAGKNGVEFVVATGDGKVEFVSFGTHTLACVKSARQSDSSVTADEDPSRTNAPLRLRQPSDTTRSIPAPDLSSNPLKSQYASVCFSVGSIRLSST